MSESYVEQNEGNLLIKERIEANQLFTAGKLGMSEFLGVQVMLGGNLPQGDIRKLLTVNAGVFPDEDSTISSFIDTYLDSMSTLDILATWINYDKECVATKNSEFYPVPLRSLEPYYFDDPWSAALEDKRVTVVTPFVESIEKQYNRRKEIWGGNRSRSSKEVLPLFKLSLVKAPFHSMQKSEYNDWFEALEDLYNQTMQFDPDLVIVGAGAFALPLLSKLKKSGVSGIHLGGGTQILFGIKGSRWDEHEVISTFFNDSWIRPLPHETPQQQGLVEGGCYW